MARSVVERAADLVDKLDPSLLGQCEAVVDDATRVIAPAHCPNCGTAVPLGARFCPTCGCGTAPGAAAPATTAPPVGDPMGVVVPPSAAAPVAWAPAAPQPVPMAYPPAPPAPGYAPAFAPPPKDKSVGAALVLTILFGPLGLFYCVPWWGALLMFLGAIILAIPTVGIGPLIISVVSIIWGAVAASNQHTEFQKWLASQPQTFLPPPAGQP